MDYKKLEEKLFFYAENPSQEFRKKLKTKLNSRLFGEKESEAIVKEQKSFSFWPRAAFSFGVFALFILSSFFTLKYFKNPGTKNFNTSENLNTEIIDSKNLQLTQNKIRENIETVSFGGKQIAIEAEYEALQDEIEEELQLPQVYIADPDFKEKIVTRVSNLVSEKIEELGNLSPEISNDSKPDSLSPDSAYIENIRLYDEGKLVAENDYLNPLHTYSFNFDLKSTAGEGEFNDYLILEIKAKFENSEKNIYTTFHEKTGPHAVNIFNSLIDPFENSEACYFDEVFFSFTISNSSSDTEQNYQLTPLCSEKGLGSLIGGVASDVSKSGELDRKMIPGATLHLNKIGQSEEIITDYSGIAGNIHLQNLDPGDYEISATYKGISSSKYEVSILPDDTFNIPSENYIFITIPIKPDSIDLIPGEFWGQISYHDNVQARVFTGVPNLEIHLYEASNWNSTEDATLVATTSTDIYGAFHFYDLAPEKYYFYTYEIPEGWQANTENGVRIPYIFPILNGEQSQNYWEIIVPS